MSRMKKFLSFLLVFVMTFSMCIQVFADSEAVHTITIQGDKPGHTYEAYQIFSGDLDSTGKILSNVEWGSGVDGELLLDFLQDYSEYESCESAADVAKVLEGLSDESGDLDFFAEIVSETLYEVAGTSTEETAPYTISVKGDGFYFIQDAEGTVASDGDAYTKYILKIGDSVTINEKANAPTFEKKVLENGKESDTVTAEFGDDLYFSMNSKVPDMDGYTKYYYIIHDTMSGMSYEEDSLYVKIGSQKLDETAYEVNQTELEDGCSFEIVFHNFIQYKELKGEDIYISYKANVSESANVGNQGNTNKAHLEYSCNPNEELAGDINNPDKPAQGEDTLTTPEDYTICYVTEVKILKVDDSDEENPLDGAQFNLERPVPVSLDKEETSDIMPVSAGVGEHYFTGLSAGTYYFKEIVAPDGYNLLKETINIEIDYIAPDEVVTGTEEATWKYCLSGAIEQDWTEDEDGKIEIKVVNQKGATLPSTGGMGTTIFYVTGLMLMLGSALWYVGRKVVNER